MKAFLVNRVGDFGGFVLGIGGVLAFVAHWIMPKPSHASVNMQAQVPYPYYGY